MYSYPKLDALIRATNKAEDYLERNEGAACWSQWERDSRRSLDWDCVRISVMKAVWDRLTGSGSGPAIDDTIDNAIKRGFCPREVESIRSEMAAYLARN